MSDEKVLVSRVITGFEGKSYLEVDGKPFLYNSVQSWYPPEADYRLYMEKAAEVNYKVFTFWLCWRHQEPVEGCYNWAKLDKVIKLAIEYNLRLDIVWAGTNFCGHLDPRFAPDWLLNRHSWHLKDSEGNCKELDGFDMSVCHGIDCRNQEALAKEKKFIADMMQHLREFDRSHRVILFQVENEININNWTGQDKQEVLNYCNEIGGVVKESPYSIATRINLVNGENDAAVNCLANIDFYGPDPYSAKIADIRRIIYDTENSRMPYIAENAAYENSTSLIIAALAGGGFYNIYKIDYDNIWNKPGVYYNNWSYWSVTSKIQNLNKALNKIGQLITVSPRSKMVEFNTEDDKPEVNYSCSKTLSEKKIGYKCKAGKASVGMIIEHLGSYYLVSDEDAVFTVEYRPETCEVGYFDDSGTWQKECEQTIRKISDAEYAISYRAGDCIRVK